MEEGEKPADTSYDLLWLLLKHANHNKVTQLPVTISQRALTTSQVYDWDAIAEINGSTKGACSKRWSRLKLAFEKGDPATPAKSAPVTPRKDPKAMSKNDVESTPTATLKRKRTPVKKIVDTTEDDEDEEVGAKPKRAKSAVKVKPRPKNAFRASDEKESKITVKDEHSEESSDVFVDAPQEAAGVETEEVCKFTPSPSFAPAPYGEWC